MLPNQIINHEHASVLPVDTFYDLAVEKLLETHEKLDQLPKNPFGDDTPNLTALKGDLGIPTSDTEILSQIMQNAVIGALAGTFGVVAHSATANAIDFGISMMSESKNENTPRQTFKRASDHKPTNGFRATFKKAHEPAKKPAMPHTNILRQAMMKKQMASYKNTLQTRKRLERQLADLKEKIQLLNIYKKQDISYVKLSADGKELTPINGKPRFVFEMERKKHENRMAYERQFNAPAPRLAA
ncbi:MAG TPA: hypothetical protein VIN59_06825 [Alphaproteobacteria bacterium]